MDYALNIQDLCPLKIILLAKLEEGCWGPRGDFVCMVFIAVTVIPSMVPSWKKSSILLVK